ncbi:LysR family transcriptional regulator [Arenibacterium sp. CAU 1754]
MMWRDMPPLAALRAFSAFVEAGNVVQAGEALNVSHAAISQQLRALEEHMGVTLLDRSGRALRLTDAGAQLAQALQVGFGAISSVVNELTGADAARAVHISSTPSFAANWLMPRLSDFRAAHPAVNLMLDPSPILVDLKPGGFDIALRYGSGDWTGLDAEMLVQSPLVVIAAPALLKGRKTTQLADLSELPWLEELGTTEGSNWLRSKGFEQGIIGPTVQVPGNLVLDGVRNGQGVAVTVRTFVEADIEVGRVVALHEEPGDKGYHIVTRPGVLRPAARTFQAWLRRAAKAA